MATSPRPRDADHEPSSIDEEPLRYALGMVFLTVDNLLETTLHYTKKSFTNGLAATKYLVYAAIVYAAYLLITHAFYSAVTNLAERAAERIERQDSIPDIIGVLVGIAIAAFALYATYRVAIWAVQPFKPIVALADAQTGDRTPDLSEFA